MSDLDVGTGLVDGGSECGGWTHGCLLGLKGVMLVAGCITSGG